ncbi:uncharacterized protein PHACADRAFT_261628 [Phanerochaete carnosa HHB-10118-sp]|uniref:DUF6533 domain-containing protein n=1 Tax=Phanerochaete carnosa (strain HHB-10118-sp) TaxID=650164 RepID=K5VY05_PHACS|nr:uncharacterized protein PHACADRAFT_261628 [Phanerochaete carnosa HHB-10118-sp]EKM51479.1 hypothetical protein PHACADRAFT_261628 [Phanerochaete carnosa HHB-10118-sp]
MSDPSQELPPSLNLPAHLSAHKYFFVCTLTVAAWDTLVLSPRSWRLLRTKEWPFLKIAYHFLRVFMPLEFTVVGVAFFDTKWSLETCSHFFLFEPICTAILLAVCSAVHVIRIHAIYDKSRNVLTVMGGLFALQIIVTAICCGFYQVTPLEVGQGCIASPKHNWVGLYWLSATLLYTASLVLALRRSFRSLKDKPISYWKLMLRDGLNLYAAIWAVNMVNMLFWFIVKPTGPDDPIRVIVTSMAAVLTTSMTLRIILAVRGSLAKGGAFAGRSGHAQSHPSTHVVSRPAPQSGPILSLQHPQQQTYTVGLAAEPKAHDWTDDKESEQIAEVKGDDVYPIEEGGTPTQEEGPKGVKITIDTETDYEGFAKK